MPEFTEMRPPNPGPIEFVFFDAGGGHRAAATALAMAIQAERRPWDVRLLNLQELLDPLDILKKFTGMRIQDCYNTLLRNGWTLGSPQLLRVLQAAIRMYHTPTVRMLESHWKKSQPAMVVSFVPHFNRSLGESLSRTFPGLPFVTVLTDIADYPPHFWIERQHQFLVCGSEFAVHQALISGHTTDRIFRASGMILHPRFYEAPVEDRPSARALLGLRPDLPTGLVLFGGHGSRAMLEIADRLERSTLNLQMIYICGKSEKLAESLRSKKSRLPRFVEDFTSRVNYYMQLADFFIGKPGPASVSEALAMQLPVIVECNAWTLPQERYNAQWIIQKKVGLVLRSFRDIEQAVAQLIEPAMLARYRANAAALQNRAVFEIPGMLQSIFEQSNGEGAITRAHLTGQRV